MKSKLLIFLITACAFLTFHITNAQALANDNNQAGDLGISIDGKFDDWADKDKHPMKASGDDDNIKNVSFLTDNNNIYLYISMEPKLVDGYTDFQPSGYILTVGGKVFYVSFNDNRTVHLNVDESKAVSLGIYGADGSNKTLNDLVYVNRRNITQHRYVQGTLRPTKGTSYRFEAKIPFKDLHNISNTAGQNIKIENPNLWNGSVQASGGSTGPVLLASTGFVIALGSVVGLPILKKRRQS
ncbi:Firmicu-CTERM sorting domain-containing protein [Companilactobacillus sp. HBUAS56275]|uniref:Firmicu-CTERM sorting domain-containing protein n=1 Tax=Companilactobacillus sp. HBUAS56275 TaxID=3109364 RepID=UPI002FEFFB66